MATHQAPASRPVRPTPEWLQPVRLPADAFTEFSQRLTESLRQLEAKQGGSGAALAFRRSSES